MGIKRMLLSKLAWIILGFVVFYLIGLSFNFIPQPVQDIVNWGAANFTTLVFLLCFMVGAYLVNKVIKTRRGET